MPAIDSCEPAVIAALEKEGWRVTDRQYPIEFLEGGYVIADLRIRRGESADVQIAYIVEVKCFANEFAQLQEFYGAVGQYMLYRNALRQIGLLEPVYLAVPSFAYQGFFRLSAVQATIEDAAMKLVVVDLATEEIIQWQH